MSIGMARKSSRRGRTADIRSREGVISHNPRLQENLDFSRCTIVLKVSAFGFSSGIGTLPLRW
jgi:hypothetical protein